MIQGEGYTPILGYLYQLLNEKNVSPAGQAIVFFLHMNADNRKAICSASPQMIAIFTGLKNQTIRNELQELRKKGFVIYKSSNSPRSKKYYLPLCKLQTSRKKTRGTTLITPTWEESLFRAQLEFEPITKVIEVTVKKKKSGKNKEKVKKKKKIVVVSVRHQIVDLLIDGSWITKHYHIFSRSIKNTELNAEVIESFDVSESSRRAHMKEKSSGNLGANDASRKGAKAVADNLRGKG